MSLDGDRCRFKLDADGLRRASAAAIMGSGWTSLDLLGPGLLVSMTAFKNNGSPTHSLSTVPIDSTLLFRKEA